MDEPTVLVLGAYGLAGRAIVEELIKDTSYRVRATGRSAEKLQQVTSGADSDRVQTCIVDAHDAREVRKVCDGASVIINAIGPYSRFGTGVARIALDCALPYVDCANEQYYYQQLMLLDGDARACKAPLITAAGAIPGWSTMLAADLLNQFPAATEVDCYWVHLRLPHADSGLASVMGGILEVGHRPVALAMGQSTPVIVGESFKTIDLPEPFGRRRMLEVPTIDSLIIPRHHGLQEFHSWFYFGDLPAWMLRVIRGLHPNRRPTVYRIIERVVRYLNERDTAKAIASGVGAEGLLLVAVRNASEERISQIVFRDGAQATARLPVLVTRALLSERKIPSGVLTPLDLFQPRDVLANLGSTVIHATFANSSRPF